LCHCITKGFVTFGSAAAYSFEEEQTRMVKRGRKSSCKPAEEAPNASPAYEA